jgi:hypothetical protein
MWPHALLRAAGKLRGHAGRPSGSLAPARCSWVRWKWRCSSSGACSGHHEHIWAPFELFLVSRPSVMAVAWKLQQVASLPFLERPAAKPLTPLGGQKGSAGLVRALERRDRRCGQSVSKSSCAWARRAGSAQGTFPSALPGSTAVLGCFSHQPDALTCHTLRGKPASTGRGGVSRASKCRRWPAVMTPRHAALRADDAVASHRAADGAGPSIEGARTCAHGISRGAVVRFCAFRATSAPKPGQLGFAKPRPLIFPG